MKIDTLPVGMLNTNCYIVYSEGADRALVIDPGAEAERIEAALEDKKPAAVLLTHGHFDHTGALWAFADTPIYIHPADAAMLGDPRLSLAGNFRDRAPRPAATDFVQEGAKMHLAGLDVAVMHLPGHTPGSVGYLIGDVLFSGDTLFQGSYGRTDFPGGDLRAMMQSLSRLLRSGKNWIVCPGHGEPTNILAEREHYRL